MRSRKWRTRQCSGRRCAPPLNRSVIFSIAPLGLTPGRTARRRVFSCLDRPNKNNKRSSAISKPTSPCRTSFAFCCSRELKFARFLENCDDVASYAKNYLAVHFKLDYVTSNGDISNYYPGFLVKLSAKRIVIVDTKGQEDLETYLRLAPDAEDADEIR